MAMVMMRAGEIPKPRCSKNVTLFSSLQLAVACRVRGRLGKSIQLLLLGLEQQLGWSRVSCHVEKVRRKSPTVDTRTLVVWTMKLPMSGCRGDGECKSSRNNQERLAHRPSCVFQCCTLNDQEGLGIYEDRYS